MILATQIVTCLCFGQSRLSDSKNASTSKENLTLSTSTRSAEVRPQLQEKTSSLSSTSKRLSEADGSARNENRLLLNLKKMQIDERGKASPLSAEKLTEVGPGSGGGGGSCALVLVAHLRVLLNYLDPEDPSTGWLLTPEQKAAVLSAIKQTEFFLQSDLAHKGLKVDFINYKDRDIKGDFPAYSILVDQKFCETTSRLTAKTTATLLHEFLRLAEIEDAAPDFPVSSLLLSRLSFSMRETLLKGQVYTCTLNQSETQQPLQRFEVTLHGAKVGGRLLLVDAKTNAEKELDYFTNEGNQANVLGLNTFGSRKMLQVHLTAGTDDYIANLNFNAQQGRVVMQGRRTGVSFRQDSQMTCSERAMP